jgi:hypothetical protein
MLTTTAHGRAQRFEKQHLFYFVLIFLVFSFIVLFCL